MGEQDFLSHPFYSEKQKIPTFIVGIFYYIMT